MPLFTYVFGLANCLATRHFQRLGDLGTGTGGGPCVSPGAKKGMRR